MNKRITILARDPFYVCYAERALALFIDPPTGDVRIGSAALYAWRGIVFSLVPESTGHVLMLQYADTTFPIGYIEDTAEAASWVEDANRLLEAKKNSAPENGVAAPALSAPARKVS